MDTDSIWKVGIHLVQAYELFPFIAEIEVLLFICYLIYEAFPHKAADVRVDQPNGMHLLNGNQKK